MPEQRYSAYDYRKDFMIYYNESDNEKVQRSTYSANQTTGSSTWVSELALIIQGEAA
jgi:hypothetical protein